MWLSIFAIIGGSAYGGWMLYQISMGKVEGDKYKQYY
jgi:hypothetical protein